MAVSDFFLNRVKACGWFSVTNIYFDNCYVLNPQIQHGYVCLSPSAEMIFAYEKHDGSNTDAIEKQYLIMDNKYLGFQRTVVCVGFEHLQHFDMLLFTHDRHYSDTDTEFLVPTYPSAATAEAMTPDPETGLYAGTNTVTMMDNREISAFELFPSKSLDEYVGLRVDPFKTFNANQKRFATAMNKLMGLTDCI